MSDLHPFIGKQVEVTLSGNNMYTGTFIDTGSDVMVLSHEQRFFYIPLVHVQNLKTLQSDEDIGLPPEVPIDFQTDSLSFRKILQHAKGSFVEIYITGNKTIHGYLTSIMNDYFVFYSPLYKAMFISMNHVKWLVPYSSDATPYSLATQFLSPTNISLSRTFAEQCKRLEGNLVVFDSGDNPNKIGLLQKANSQFMELIIADGNKQIWNIHHLKTVYMP
ncbi:LSm family protein [Paenibacillus sp. SI8]|uniref:LSm family protein n=1 Tax=unclassified Paenibacillus TaxID=185978 RepID=UPI00346690C3